MLEVLKSKYLSQFYLEEYHSINQNVAIKSFIPKEQELDFFKRNIYCKKLYK
jgi:hypothetical protein